MTTPAENQALQDRLVKAALNDPLVYDKDFDASRVFALISVLLNSPSSPKRQLVRSMKTVYLFNVTNNEGKSARWWVDMKKKGIVRLLSSNEKAPLKPDVTISLSDKDLVGLANGTLNPMKLYEARRVHVRGDIDKAFNVEKILSQERQKLEALRSDSASSDASPRGGAGSSSSMSSSSMKKPRKEIWGERKLVDSGPGSGGAVRAKL
ncbi:hypothetical protein JCM10212_004502 [Sporobolomyces blumeae]